MNGKFEQVPPPKEAPLNPTAEALGLCRGLKAEKSWCGPWRCCNCNRMQTADALLVWVSDGVRIGDPGWSIEENERRNAYNGHGGGWCLSCAKKLCRPKWWRRLWNSVAK